MKRIIIKILIFGIISLIVLSIASIPPKLDPEKVDACIQREMNKMREIIEEHWPNMPEEEREETLKMSENTLRNSFEHQNSFSYRFATNLHAYCIGVPIAIVVGVLGWIHRRELHGR